MIVPLAMTLWFSLQRYNLLSPGMKRFAGLSNYTSLITDAALWRENSVGAHYRADFAEANRPGWRLHSQLLLRSAQTSGKQRREQDLVLAPRAAGDGTTERKKRGRS